MVTQTIAPKTHSIEEYLAREETAAQHHKYIDGEIVILEAEPRDKK